MTSISPPDRLSTLTLVTMATIMIYATAAAKILSVDLNIALLPAYAALAAGVPLIYWRTREAEAGNRLVPMFVIVGLLLLMLWMSTALVDLAGLRRDIGAVWRQVLMMTLATLPFFAAFRLARRAETDGLLVWIAHVATAVAATSILLEAAGLTRFERYGTRAFGFLSDPAAMLLTYGFAIYLFSNMRVMAGVVIVALLMTLSRGPIGLCLAVAAVMLMSSRREFLLRSLVLAVAAVALAYFFKDELAGLAGRFGRIDVNEGRIRTPLEGLKLFRQSPVFGQGYAAMGYYFPMIAGQFRRGIFSTASSPVVQMLSDGGLMLFTAYLAMIIGVLGGIARHIPEMMTQKRLAWAGAAAWLACFLLVNQSAAWFLAGGTIQPLFFAVLGLVAGRLHQRRDAPHKLAVGSSW